MKFFKTIVPAIERAYYSFISVDRKSKILAYGNGISMVYDENWNVLDKRAEFQARNPALIFICSKKVLADSNSFEWLRLFRMVTLVSDDYQ